NAMSKGNAHIFLVHGDIRSIACDGWLLPCDDAWQHEAKNWYPKDVQGWTARPQHVFADNSIAYVDQWPPPNAPKHLSRPWLVDVVGVEQPISFFVERALRFVEVVSDWLHAHPEGI